MMATDHPARPEWMEPDPERPGMWRVRDTTAEDGERQQTTADGGEQQPTTADDERPTG